MNPNLTELAVVLDRSGSMASVASDAIGGYNAFVDAQAAAPGDARLTLVLFDHEYDVVCDAAPIATAPRLDAHTYVPRGTTALLDAIGRTVDALGARLAATPEADRPAKVVVAILTDGMENDSHTYTRPQIFDTIRHQTDVYGWEFVFLAANQDAIEAGTALGIVAEDSLSFDATGAGTTMAFSRMSDSVMAKRSAPRRRPPVVPPLPPAGEA